MKVIRDYSDIELVKQFLPQQPEVTQYIESEWLSLFGELEEDDDTIMVLLEPDDTDLNVLGLHGSLVEQWLEYVDLVNLDNHQRMYRIGIMPDNEYMIIIYVIKDTLDPQIEIWLAEQAEH